MAEVNFGKLFGILAKNLCEDCGLRAGEWAGDADGGQNLCEYCAMREYYGEPVYACPKCAQPAWTMNGNCTNANC